jgi:mannose-6-phosphate isomerase class I
MEGVKGRLITDIMLLHIIIKILQINRVLSVNLYPPDKNARKGKTMVQKEIQRMGDN